MMVPLTGGYDSADRAPTTTAHVEEGECSTAVLSQYASAKSDVGEGDHMNVVKTSWSSSLS